MKFVLCRRLTILPVLGIVLALFATASFAQMNTADIGGMVTDPTGAVIRGATVTAQEVATDQKHTAMTNDAGQYLLAKLPLGEYKLTVDATGFRQALQRGVILHAEDHIRQDFAMQLGDANQTVTVEATTGALQVESEEIKNILENQAVVDLPLKGRDFLELAILSPGIVNPPGGTRGDSLQQTGKLINILGNRTGHNLFLVDGVSVTDEYFNNVALSPAPDATREFNILLTDYSAEFGGKSGGVINVVTQSGTNHIHGDVYEFVRNNVFDAQNYFAPPNVPAPFRENQFGAAVGGPIIKNKTFFFVNYDGQRVRAPATQVFSVPTAAERTGNLSGLIAAGTTIHDPITKAVIAGNNLNNDANFNVNNPGTKAALALLNLAPLPTGAGNTNNLRAVREQSVTNNQYDARLDQQIGTADTVFARFGLFDANEFDPFGSSVLNETLLPPFSRLLKTHTENLAVGETHIFSSNVVNEFRFGWLRVSGGQKDPNGGNPFAATFGLAGTTTNPADMGYPQANLSGVFTTLGTAAGFNTRVDRNVELFDNVSLHRGHHNVTFGGYFFHLAFNPQFPNNARGVYTFNGTYTGNAFADYLFGYPSQGQVGIGEANESAHTNWGHFYVQDGWQVTPNLHFDIGLRYEYNSNLFADSNQTSDIDLSTGVARFVVAGNPAALSPQAAALTAIAAAQTPTAIPVVSASSAGWNGSLVDTQPYRFSPRVGAAWQVPGMNGLVLRAGFGLFTNQASYSVLNALAQNVPFFLTKTIGNAAGTPTLTLNNILAANPNNGSITPNGVNHDFQIEYNEVWNATAEKSLSTNTTVSVQYVGSRTVHADSSTAVNLPTPGAGAVQGRRPFSNLNSFVTLRWDGWASFNGLTVRATHRFSHGFTFDASYTLSHSIDDASDAGGTNAEFNLPQNIYAHNLSVEKADSSFDHRNRFVGNFLYDLPFARQSSGWMKAVAGGWSTGGILIAQSGAPFSVNLGPTNDVANIGLVGGNNLQRPNVSGDPNAGTHTAAHWFNTAAFSLPAAFTFGNTPRNAVIGPRYVDFDASLQKEWALRESTNLEFRVDAYNLFNHPNFNLPGRIFGAANFGVIQSAQDPREMQFALKLNF